MCGEFVEEAMSTHSSNNGQKTASKKRIFFFPPQVMLMFTKKQKLMLIIVLPGATRMKTTTLQLLKTNPLQQLPHVRLALAVAAQHSQSLQ